MTKRDTLAFEYFKAFTTFEAKLKSLGYHNRANSSAVNVDWDRVAKDYERQIKLILDKKSKEIVYLMINPPRKMIVVNSAVQFIDLNHNTKQERKLLMILYTVRNNLYHGGKFAHGELVGSERDVKLVKSATAVLKNIKI